MMVFGVDPHQQSHTAVAVDELGREKAHKTVRARRDGHRELIGWARQACPGERKWAVEDVRHLAGGLIRDLLAAGETVVFVPPKLMAGARRGGRERASPIRSTRWRSRGPRCARPPLPAARLDQQVLQVRRLTNYRDNLIGERTRVIERLRWMVHDLAPELAPKPRALASFRSRAKLEGRPARPAGLGRPGDLAVPAGTHRRPDRRSRPGRAGTGRPGAPAGPRPAAGHRHRRDHRRQDPGRDRRHPPIPQPGRLHPHNGTAPIPASSGNRDVHHLNRAGTRQLNAALHRTALVQARCHDGARALLARRGETAHETPKPASAYSNATCLTSFTAPSPPTPGASMAPPSKQLDIGASHSAAGLPDPGTGTVRAAGMNTVTNLARPVPAKISTLAG